MAGIEAVSGIAGALAPAEVAPAGAAERAARPAGFADALAGAMDSLLESQRAGEAASMEFAAGRTDDVAATMIAIHKADLSRQLALEVRNRMVDAYHEIMRMTV